MYLYSIEINEPRHARVCGLKHTRVSRDEYKEGDSFRLCQIDSSFTLDENCEEDHPFPEEVWGTVVKWKLIHEEEIIIDSVTVVKIHKDEVEFERDGHRWTQKEGDEADPAWW
jgi:hypothetical protein